MATVVLLISNRSEAVYPSACTVTHLQAGGSVKGGGGGSVVSTKALIVNPNWKHI